MPPTTPTTIRAAEVAKVTGLSLREVWRRASDPTSGFPRPHKLSHRVTVFDYAAVVRWAKGQLLEH